MTPQPPQQPHSQHLWKWLVSNFGQQAMDDLQVASNMNADELVAYAITCAENVMFEEISQLHHKHKTT